MKPAALGMLGALLAALALAAPASAGTAQKPATARPAPAQAVALPADAQALLEWLRKTGDNEGEPFVVIDKRGARLWLFDARGEPLGHSPVLLGLAVGDASVPGIGEREMSSILPHERTTPAGRFIAEPGRNASGEDIFWVDYDAAVSMHRVRANNTAERRLQRLATPTASDNRISYGCINVPAAFYDQLLRPTLSGRRGVVYLLPETLRLDSLFSGALQPAAASPASAPKAAKAAKAANTANAAKVAAKPVSARSSKPSGQIAAVQRSRASTHAAPALASGRWVAGKWVSATQTR